MPKQEQFGGGEKAETKNEIPPQTEKKESMIDTAYFSSVSRYFNRRKEDLMRGKENPNDDDLKYEEFLNEQQSMLGKVANAKQLEKLQPKDVSFALSELAGMMASNREQNPNIPVDESDQEKEYLEAKKIFMETCKKVFPEIKPEVSRDVPYLETGKLNRLGIKGLGVPASEGGKLLKDDPRELAKRLDMILASSGDHMKSTAYEGFTAEDLKDTENAEMKLGMGVISLYKLQLMRDQLTKQVYGREDITPSEEKEMDEARGKVK